MSEYEFWDELGNIFNAIVAYQHKTIEFNKRFVNPWLRLGTVFDQNDHNSDAILAARKAIEIDHENGSNWLSLGDVYFKMGSFDDAANAYGKAIELNPKLGWAYANLALTNATRQKYTEAVNLYVKSLELIEDDKDRSMIWNRLGNVYRKVNDYENAFIAFQMADECDGQNTGFQDQLDEVTPEQKVMPIFAEVYVNNTSRPSVESQPEAKDEPVAVDEPADEMIAVSVEQEAGLDEAKEEAVSEEIVVEEVQPEAVVETSVEQPMTEEALPDLAEETVSEEGLMEDIQPELVAETSTEETVSEEVVVEEAQPEAVAESSVEESVAEEAQPMVEEETVSDVVAIEETSVIEPAAEETQPEIVAEASIEESLDEKAQSDIVVEASVDEPVAEEAQPEVVAEISVEESVSEEVQLDVVAETSVTESISKETQPQVVEESVSEELVVEETPPLVTAGTSVEEVADEGQQPVAETETLVEENVSVEEIHLEVIAETPEVDTANKSGLAATVAAPSIEEPVFEIAQPVTEDTTGNLLKADASTDTIMAFLASEGVETFADPSSLNQPVVLVIEDLAELIKKSAPGEDIEAKNPADETEAQSEVQFEANAVVDNIVAEADILSESANVDDDVAEVVAEIVALANGGTKGAIEIVDDTQPDAEVEASVPDTDVEPAYEEFLKNVVEPVVAEGEKSPKNDLKAEPDSKNAHVWNELGNVYFNTGAFEEAVTAYSKAIELDDWFAWPYSNLALVYVQKEKYAEAILLYQRSIELFSSDKDKAITWNRLGNVYRRLTDYDNAIACYQRADELDPNNATRSLRSRFSLLGSLNVEQSTSMAG